MKEPLLHAIVGTNILQDIPSKLLVELPRHKDHANCAEGNNGRDGDKIRLDIAPKLLGVGISIEGIVVPKNHNGFLDLVDLNGRVNHEGEVGNADSNDLNRVLHPQGIPNDHQNV